MTVLAVSWLDVAYEHGLAFLLGAGAGFVLANRYRITRRNGGGDGRKS